MFYRFRHRLVGVVVIGWLVLTSIGLGLRVEEGERLAQSVSASARAAQLDGSLDRLFYSIQDAETGQRGYLLTGAESYLEPFKNAEADLPKIFDELAPMVNGDKALQKELLELRGLTAVKMTEMRDAIKIRQEKNLPAAVTFVESNKGKEAMDRIRQLTGQMHRRLVPVVAGAEQATQQHLARTQSLDLVAGVLGVGAGLFALYLVRVGYLQEKGRRELLEQTMRAEKIMVEKSAFLANISHEIRTPMNAILGFGELLADESLTHRQSEYVRCIRQSGKSLLQLINDVLDLSKLEAGKLEICLEPTNVQEICSFLQIMFAQQAAGKSVQLKWETEGVPNALLLDRLRLRQVLMNLVGNAVKFTTRGQVLTRVEWIRELGDSSRGTLWFHVEDSGMGISPEKQEEIFKPFVQSNPSSAAEKEGTGLGLHLVRRLTEIMGGAVTLDSTPGLGSAFHVRLPEVSISARLPVTDEIETADAVNFNDFAPVTLLMVDDSETNRTLVARMFDGTHHRIRHACDGREALASIEESKPNLVLLDIRMPHLDGHETLAAIRKMPGLELLPVIAVSASDPENDEEQLRRRFNAYIRKPFTRQTLYKELALFLPRRPQTVPAAAGGLDDSVDDELVHIAMKARDREVLTEELHTLLASEWAELRESLAINETLALAGKLQSLAQAAHCVPLKAYALALTRHAQTYSVHELENLIAEFPALVQTLEQDPTPAQHD
ncbi:MAG TPA: CHASE3 domain-containing protein [Verrucomicrobiae bacterium]|jgi:signal transduction histidine kinase/CheY-like chemotaxis protein|nr:CHASE3 domain-containing protein [Verrucomicrobiae bacterium]